MTKVLEAIISAPSPVRSQWLSPDLAVREVLAFERRFGSGHLKLACHAALPLILSPTLLNLIRINFFEEDEVLWIAETDFLLSSLCCPVGDGLFEVEPAIREVLLIELEDQFDWVRPFELASFLQSYLAHKTGLDRASNILRTQHWIAQAYLNPDQLVAEFKDFLDSSLADESLAGITNQTLAANTLELIAEPLSRSSRWEDYQYLVSNTNLLAQLLYEDEKKLKKKLNSKNLQNSGEINLISPPLLRLLETLQEPNTVNAPKSILSQTDPIESEQAQEELLHDALHDELTRLPNRTLLINRLRRAIERTKSGDDYRFAVLLLDLDRFEVVNDSLGNAIGDQLLIAIARHLETYITTKDTIARLDGNEFAILLEDVKDLTDATHLAERILERWSSPFNINGQEILTTASIGIVLSEARHDRPEELLRDVDLAMYQAKSQGRGRYEIFDIATHNQALAFLQFENNLRRAVMGTHSDSPSQELQLRYQPIVSLETGRIIGFEALVYWQHPEQGLILPTEFIPTAEETGLIVPLEQWSLSEACRQLRSWQQHFPESQHLSINVNFSSKQFSQIDLTQQISQILKQNTLASGDLKLELNGFMEDIKAVEVLEQLKSLGVKLLLDNFGEGFASLSYLHRFPFDTLKLPESFVSRMETDNDGAEIIRTVTTLAHNLDINIVAEGVETEEQMMQLTALGVEYGQGHFFAQPLTYEEVEALITSVPHWLNAFT
ncbi:EAL domain-containing protein [Trichocoleus desertorum AS-A10]|uniref:putative bifunctional diguanylate cyclase/phosphodiesterase n=1 Tax=Trichocoleus desertorum TaxID=1481672 RepID=UPI003297B2FB